jgi:uncharacterized protein YndB with AHSA1/START domain
MCNSGVAANDGRQLVTPAANDGSRQRRPAANDTGGHRRQQAKDDDEGVHPMSEDRIEREILIAATLERVWPLVAEPGFWVADEANLTGTVAKEGESMVARNAKYGDFPVRVEKVEPPTYLAYRWTSAFPGAELREDNSTLVEFTLTPEGDKTRLRVVESGFAALAGSAELRDKAVRDNTRGWPDVLDAFKSRVE